jgi:hypothetical protein
MQTVESRGVFAVPSADSWRLMPCPPPRHRVWLAGVPNMEMMYRRHFKVTVDMKGEPMPSFAKFSAHRPEKPTVVFDTPTEQKMCGTCFVIAELKADTSLSAANRAMVNAIENAHDKFKKEERHAVDDRFSRIAAAPNPKEFAVSFDCAKCIPAIQSRAHLSDIEQLKRPVQWMFLSMRNGNLNRMRFMTSPVKYVKGTNLVCTATWEEVRTMVLRAQNKPPGTECDLPTVSRRSLPDWAHNRLPYRSFGATQTVVAAASLRVLSSFRP